VGRKYRPLIFQMGHEVQYAPSAGASSVRDGKVASICPGARSKPYLCIRPGAILLGVTLPRRREGLGTANRGGVGGGSPSGILPLPRWGPPVSVTHSSHVPEWGRVSYTGCNVWPLQMLVVDRAMGPRSIVS